MFFFKSKDKKTYNPDFVLVTGESCFYYLNQWQKKQLCMYSFPSDLAISQKDYNSKIMKRKIMKRLYIQLHLFISNNIDYMKKATIIANSNYTRNAIKKYGIWILLL